MTAGANTVITVTVTAEDGSTKQAYTITVYSQRSNRSDNANLSVLSLSGVSLSPVFDPETTAYDARVRYDVDEVTVVATTADIGAMVPVVGFNAVLTTDDAAAVDEATNRVVTLGGVGHITAITVTVTPETGDATDNEVYTITVYRENIVLSDAALLAAEGLTLGFGTVITNNLTPAFAFLPGTNEYTGRVDNVADFVTVGTTLATGNRGAKVDTMPADRDSLAGGHQVYLAAGAHTAITVTVTAEDGSTNTYTVTLYRKSAPASTDATLSELSLSGAVLSPVFDPERYDYTARAAYDTDITTVTATVNDIGAMVTGITTDPPTSLVGMGPQVTLSSRTVTLITVTVRPESDTDDTMDQDYIIRVYRDSAPSTDATLETLTLSGLTLSPAFDPATTAYTSRG